MDNKDLVDIAKSLDEIKISQQALLKISKNHLELYAEQLNKSEQLNKLFIDLQEKSQQNQRYAIILALVTIVAAALYVLILSQ